MASPSPTDDPFPQVESQHGPGVDSAAAVEMWPLTGIPEIAAGADLAGELVAALRRAPGDLRDGDVLVVSSKVVSKAAGLRAPAAHRAGLVLAESERVVAERLGPAGVARIVAAKAGPVLAGAGIDASNLGSLPVGAVDAGGQGGDVLLLPRDPDAAARALLIGVCAALSARGLEAPDRLGLLVSDTAGRPWRTGQADIAIGAADMPVVEDLRGGVDADGRPLGVTVRAVADELASAADLVKGKVARVPAALVRGWTWPAPPIPAPEAAAAEGAATLIRRGGGDWFALGHVEAVRAALGVRPGTPEAVDVGIRATTSEAVPARVERACRLALFDGLGTIPAGHPRAHLAGTRPALAGARVDLVQYGVVAEAPDELTLGVVVGRLLPALAAEDVPAAFARTEPAGTGHGPRAVIVFVGEG